MCTDCSAGTNRPCQHVIEALSGCCGCAWPITPTALALSRQHQILAGHTNHPAGMVARAGVFIKGGGGGGEIFRSGRAYFPRSTIDPFLNTFHRGGGGEYECSTGGRAEAAAQVLVAVGAFRASTHLTPFIRVRRCGLCHLAWKPPSMLRIWPVTNEASSESSHTMPLTISCAVPMRFIGCMAEILASSYTP